MYPDPHCQRPIGISSCNFPERRESTPKEHIDLKKTDHEQASFLKLNPNGKVPTPVVDGTPMFEALAILQWLGDR